MHVYNSMNKSQESLKKHIVLTVVV